MISYIMETWQQREILKQESVLSIDEYEQAKISDQIERHQGHI